MHLHSTLGPCMAGSRCISIITSIMQMHEPNKTRSDRKETKEKGEGREGGRSAVSHLPSYDRDSL